MNTLFVLVNIFFITVLYFSLGICLYMYVPKKSVQFYIYSLLYEKCICTILIQFCKILKHQRYMCYSFLQNETVIITFISLTTFKVTILFLPSNRIVSRPVATKTIKLSIAFEHTLVKI